MFLAQAVSGVTSRFVLSGLRIEGDEREQREYSVERERERAPGQFDARQG